MDHVETYLQLVDHFYMYLQEQMLQFLGHKATVNMDPSNPYKIAPVTVRVSPEPRCFALP